MKEEYESSVDVEKNTVYKTVEEVLNPGKISITKPDEIVDTPTPLAAGTENKLAGIGVIVIVGLAIWYFFLRRK